MSDKFGWHFRLTEDKYSDRHSEFRLAAYYGQPANDEERAMPWQTLGAYASREAAIARIDSMRVIETKVEYL